MTEWYENGPLGLEQGFTLEHPPGVHEYEKANGQPLTVELSLRGDLVAALRPGSTALELKSKDGEGGLRYTGLKARDATGRELRGWLEVRGERLLVRVEDKGARYPLVVDPWVQQAELTTSDGKAHDTFGISVAVSGNTIVVGAPGHPYGGGRGAAYVFVQSGTSWSKQAELRADDAVTNDWFGGSVAINGSTVVVGADQHPFVVNYGPGPGVAYVFVRSGTKWSQQAYLIASNGDDSDY
jgi:hypothetical protein